MFILGVTGSSGSGKTLLCSRLADLGAAVIDCDRVYHDMLANSPELNADITAAFPEADNGGFADRKALSKIVFADSARLKELEAIVFPHIGAEIGRLLEQLRGGGAALAVLDAPTLFESGADRLCGRVVAVTADRETQIGRLRGREGLSREAALARLNARPGDDFFISRGCEMVYNNGDEGALAAQALRIYNEITEMEEESQNGRQKA